MTTEMPSTFPATRQAADTAPAGIPMPAEEPKHTQRTPAQAAQRHAERPEGMQKPETARQAAEGPRNTEMPKSTEMPKDTAKAEDADNGGLRIAGVRLPVPTMAPADSKRALWWGGLAALAVVGVLEWPVAAVVGVGSFVAEKLSREDARTEPQAR
ncbi:hypothetical protein L6E12_33570 [Actinokineospora sp. PR83]|uniref:hypothetical protein n=1 Tax=Actinokineospora sp. PR83 TaxID=2884908 RepID=UPI001F3BE0FA|nr:hypothetical protein [Actinokineospora sp. PR83]MCG8920701.1 hypothetical protein [Actinokineospora sp. PR83]